MSCHIFPKCWIIFYMVRVSDQPPWRPRAFLEAYESSGGNAGVWWGRGLLPEEVGWESPALVIMEPASFSSVALAPVPQISSTKVRPVQVLCGEF